MGGVASSRGRATVVVTGVGLAVGVILGLGGRVDPPRAPVPVAQGGGTRAMIEVHLGGWVVSPGVVSVPEGSIVADAVMAAGGMRPGAIGEAVNLAAPVMDGQQIIVPGPDQGTGEVPGEGATGVGLVAVNRAGVTELETLPGVGPVLAERIVAYRDQNGPFSRVEDLLHVPGIGESKLAAIRDLIVLP
jgi:competence protein ComEA